MSEIINLEEYSRKVNSDFVGFGLYKGRKVKPVHIANGVSRVLCGKVLNNLGIKKIALVVSKKGIPGFSTQDVFQELLDEDRIESDVKMEDFDATRRIIQKMLDADSGVFIDRYKSDHMLSFSLSSKYFVTKFAVYEDAGEFIGQVIKVACPDLADYIRDLLDEASDPISQLFIPVQNDEVASEFDGEDVFAQLFPVSERNNKTSAFIESIRTSGTCLLHNLQKEPNTLTQLRLFNLFCIFSLFRYISYLLSKIQAFIDIDPFDVSGNLDWGEIRDSGGSVYVVQLAAFDRDVQLLLTELLLWDIWGYCVKCGSEDKPFIVVLDEAQNLDHGEKSPSAKILTEGRKFGLSGWYATQFMKPQLTEDEIQRLQQAGQKLYFCPPDDGVTTVAKNIDITTQGAKDWADRLKKLKKGECVTCGNMERNGRWTRYNPRIIKITALKERTVF